MILSLRQFSYFILISSIFIAALQASYVSKDNDDQEPIINKNLEKLSLNDMPMETNQLIRHLIVLKQDIDQSHENADIDKLFKSYRLFVDQLTPQFTESNQQKIVSFFKADSWPSQQFGWEIVGGHLFFPATRLHKWLETECTAHLIGRRDMMWAYGIAAKFKHPLASFYLSERFLTINSISINCCGADSSLYKSFAKEAFTDLNQCLDHPDVAYAVARGQQPSLYLSAHYNKESSINLHHRGNDFKNRFETLRMKKCCIGSDTCDSEQRINEYLLLARQGYQVAYLEAIEFAEKHNESVKAKEILEEAVKAQYALAFIYQACVFEESNKHWFIRAGEHGITLGYIKLAIELVGNVIETNNKLKSSTLDERLEAIELFKMAGQAHDPKGYEYLGYLYYYLSGITSSETEKKYNLQETLNAWSHGCALGWRPCYQAILINGFYNHYNQLVKQIGPEPNIELASKIKHFMNNKSY